MNILSISKLLFSVSLRNYKMPSVALEIAGWATR